MSKMRKQLINTDLENSSTTNQDWIELTQQAQVELSSEDPAYPIEGALDFKNKSGWRASEEGHQCIRITLLLMSQRVSDGLSYSLRKNNSLVRRNSP
jgi:hypothetical protein